jgi:hypothetical protein
MKRAVKLPIKHVEALTQLVSGLNNQPNLDGIYKTACEGLARAISIESTFIFLYTEIERAYRLVWTFQEPADRLPVFTEPPIEPGRLKTGVPLVLHTADFWPYLEKLDLATAEIPHGVMLAVLYHEGRNIGILGASSNDQTRDFSPQELILMQFITDQVTAAIIHARLFLTTQKQVLYLQLINEITQVALSGGTLQVLLDRLAFRVVELRLADGCYISLWDENRRVLTPFTACGSNEQSFMHQPSTSVDETALETGHTIFRGKTPPPEGEDAAARPAEAFFL